MDNGLMLVIRFLSGLAVGSFINVLSLRYDPERPLVRRDILWGRSQCPSCGTTLRWFELIPVLSFFIQGGRCRACGSKLTLQYPAVELLTGLIFLFAPYGALGLFSPFWPWISLWIAVLSLFLLLTLIDLRLSVIPNEVTAALALLGIASTFFLFKFHVIHFSFAGYYAELFGLQENIFLNRLAGAAAGLALFGSLYLVSRGRAMGLGDVKLIGALGILFGWPDILLIMTLAFILGAAVNAPALFRGTRKINDAVPFGPFIAAAAAVVFFWGFEMVHWYFKVFGIA